MPIPNYEQAMIPVLRVLTEASPRHRREIAVAVSDVFNLTETERQQLLPSGKFPVIVSRVGWALSYMKQAKLVEPPKRGVYQLTDRGRQVLTDAPNGIDSEYLERFPEFREFQTRTRDSAGAEGAPTESSLATTTQPPVQSPEEALANRLFPPSRYAPSRAS